VIEQLAVQGIWTPWAQTICFACHGNTFSRGPDRTDKVVSEMEMKQKACGVTRSGDDEMGTCHKCGTDIWLRSDVGALRRLEVKIEKGGLWQTGGMCCALAVGDELEDDSKPFYMVTFEEAYLVGYYPEGDVDGEGCETAEYTDLDTEEEVLNYFKERGFV
jgi:hypothetical protein